MPVWQIYKSLRLEREFLKESPHSDLHKHYENKNQKSKARYAFYFLTVLYQGINLTKNSGSFRQNKFCKDFETLFFFWIWKLRDSIVFVKAFTKVWSLAS